MGAFTASDAFTVYREVGGDPLAIDMTAVERVYEAAALERHPVRAAAQVFTGLLDGGYFGEHSAHVAVECAIRLIGHDEVVRPLLGSLVARVTATQP